MIKLKELLNEELFGTLYGVEVYKNPKSIKRMSAELRAVSLPTGDLFVIDDADKIIHLRLHGWLRTQGIKLPLMSSYSDIDVAINKGYINWQRKEKTNDFYVSESTEPISIRTNKKIIEKYVKKIKQKNPKYNFFLEGIWGK